MNISEVDEREDHNWEDPSPRFRVHLYERTRGGSYGTRSYDLTEADILEAIEWSQNNVQGEDGLIAIGLVTTKHGPSDPGIVWLLGSDDVYASTPTKSEEAVLAKMRDRGPRPLRY